MEHKVDSKPLAGLGVGAGLILIVTLLLLPTRSGINRAGPELALVLPVAVSGVLGGRRAALVTAVFGGLAFGFAFVPPVGGLQLDMSDDAGAFAVYLVVAIAIGTLVAAETDRRRAAEHRTKEIEAMHERYQRVVAEREHLRAEADRLAVLQQVDAQRSALLRSVSHDLRTPLAAIQAVASDLRAGTPHSASTRDELLDLVCDEAGRLDRIVANLLSLSRIEAGALQPGRQAVILDELVGETTRRLGRLFGHIRLEVRIPANLPLVDIDYVQIDQVLTNLLENTARHAPKGSMVTITAAAVGGWVEVSVVDQGDGVAPDQRDTIFEPFRTGKGSASTGVGLAICKAIVEAHGGDITVEQPPCAGACFRFTLPVRHD